MASNDYCRFCKFDMKVAGMYKHSVNIFAKFSKPHSISDRLKDLGLRVIRETGRSDRICQRCVSVLQRLERDLPVYRKWEQEENYHVAMASTEDSDEGEREPTQSKTPRKKFCSSSSGRASTSRSSITERFKNGKPPIDHHYTVNCVQIPAQTKGDLLHCGKPPAKHKMADAELLMECVEEELEPWQQTHTNENPGVVGSWKRVKPGKKATRKPAVVTRVLAPAPAPTPAPALALAPVPAPASALAPSPIASTHMVLSGQTLSGNRVSSQDTAVPLLTNTPSVLTPMASVPVTALPSGFLLVLPVTSSN